MTQVRSRTNLGVVAARVFVNGPADLDAARRVQAGFHLMPLSAYLQDGLAHPDTAVAPRPRGGSMWRARGPGCGAQVTLRTVAG
jgi:hypothetical protein